MAVADRRGREEGSRKVARFGWPGEKKREIERETEDFINFSNSIYFSKKRKFLLRRDIVNGPCS